MQQLVDAGVKTDAFLKALAGGVVKNEKSKLKPHVRLRPLWVAVAQAEAVWNGCM